MLAMDHFPWDSLPTEIQRSILSLLPVSTLIACTTVSSSLRSTIQSPIFTSSYRPPTSTRQKSTETIFLFSDCYPTVSSEAYNPSSDRWSSLPIPSNLVAVQFSHGHSVLARTRLHDDQESEALIVFNPLRPNLNPRPIPPIPKGYHLLGFFTLPPSPTPHFKIVAVTNCNPLRSQIYDSALGEWRLAAETSHRFALLDSGVFMEDDGLFYCIGRCPDHILTLDITAASEWTILKLRMPAPSLLCFHLFGFSCRLFLAAAVERYGSIVGVGIWELDRTAVKWSLDCSMPDEQFATFSTGGLNGFETIDCGGLVCFYNNNDSGKTLGDSMMMCDLLEKRWWRPRRCPFPKVKGYYRHAVEPCIDLVRGSN